ncbi:MAG TPA: hypothetical protein VFI41_12570 [Gemmatimonadales bacterium]|nr:hypothetical protein [Gemmatimonadales bacterium]
MTEQELATIEEDEHNRRTWAEAALKAGTGDPFALRTAVATAQRVLALIAEIRRMRARSEGCCQCTHDQPCYCECDE